MQKVYFHTACNLRFDSSINERIYWINFESITTNIKKKGSQAVNYRLM